MFWSHLNNNCQKQIHFLKSHVGQRGNALRPVSNYWRHLSVSSTNSWIISKKKRMKTLSGLESFCCNTLGPLCKPMDSGYSSSTVCIKPLCAVCVTNIMCVTYSEEKRPLSFNKCSSQITNTSSVMSHSASIHFALPDLSYVMEPTVKTELWLT